MSDEEEQALILEQEKERCIMLESILSIKLGKHMFFEPLLRLRTGKNEECRIVDHSFWGIVNGILPDSRKEELTSNLERLNTRYLNRDSVRELHLNWHTVENIGNKLFKTIDKCKKLINKRNELMSFLEECPEPVTKRALDHESLFQPEGENSYRTWELHPLLTSIQNELDLIEVKTGSGIHEYSSAAKRFRQASLRNSDILERFVEANLKLVVSKVRRYYPCNIMEEMDLVQEGCQGLMEAVRRFDPSRGYKLSTFAVWWIRQYVIKAILRHSRLIRLPVTVQKEDSLISRAIHDLTMERGEMPSFDDLAEYMGRDRDEIEQIYLATAPSLSLDHTDGEHDATIADFLESRFRKPEQEALHSDTRERIDVALASLSDREKTIITMRFGLLDDDPCTLQDLGRIFGISRERVRQIESRALGKLREHGLLSTLSGNG
jgi:RNA polymerase sigma factor (sigma-70 family)